jgi:two-component system sensor kinase FixL
MIESQLRAVVETAIDGIILMDASGQVVVFSPACERMFGYAKEEVIGGDINFLMPAPYSAEYNQYRKDYRHARQSRITGPEREVLGRRKTGETFPMDVSVGEAERDGEIFYVGILRDVSERKRADDVRERLIEQLTASNEERANFANVASHDLREPLRMIAAFCGLLTQDYGDKLDDRGREYLSIAVSAASQMQTLLDDLVDFGRLGLEAERGRAFEPDAILSQVLENLHEAVRESGAVVTVDPLPRLFGNAVRFNRLMQNLIGNALKYVEPNEAPRVRVSALRDDGFWRISVADNGIGIESRHYDQIFEPFKRLHGKTRYYGTGLGLAICRKIVDGFGGRIWVTSRPGQGSTFSFTIKIHEEP